MQHIDLLGSSKRMADLDSFARGFFSVMGINEYEERKSSNYIGEHYFQAFNGGIGFTVCLSDEEGLDEFPCWTQINTDDDAPDTGDLEEIVKSIVVKKLLPNGFRITRIMDIGTRDAKQVNYEGAPVLSA